MFKFPKVLFTLVLMTTFGVQAADDAPSTDDVPKIGHVATAAEIAAWNIDVRPDGTGLPEGSGTVGDGEPLYEDLCASCHGDFGEGSGRYPVLAGGHDTLTNDRPEKTVGSYWPYASTLWDYINRAMPFGDAQSLSPDDVYALTAYILYLNDLMDDDGALDQDSLPAFKMPNEVNFFGPDPRPDFKPIKKRRGPCMKDCKSEVEILSRAAPLEVTPDSGTDEF